MFFFILLMSCVESINVTPEDFPDNPNHDFDGDGLMDADDCDDNNADVGLKLLYYQDSDLDGFPSQENPQEACPNQLLEGYLPPPETPDHFDCDDSDPQLTPLDQDQDGLSSCEGDCDDYRSDIRDPIRYFQDSDGDGFGWEAVEVTVCPADKPAGYVLVDAEDYDCDDSNASVYPGAKELCDDNIDNDCDSFIDNYQGSDAPQWYQDSDGDGFGQMDISTFACVAPSGYVAVFGDCDDSNALVFPDAAEFCDGLDNNCNTVVDESSAVDASLWYADTDNDGFGSPTNVQKACDQPAGYLADASDCNDSNDVIHPNALEVCNSLDDNCDGAADEGVDSSAPSDAPTWYLDSDNDGFGSASDTRIQCAQPQGYLEDSSDCDDSNAAIFPGALELCNDLDDSCDGAVDEGSVDAPTWYIDSDNDGFGHGSQSIEACAAPSGFVDNASDCDDGDSERYLGALEYCNGVDDDCNGLVDEATAVDAIAYYPDQDGDGYGQDVQPLLSCAPIASMVSNNSDCDDVLAQVRPGTSEFCNGLDDDCNGQIDDGALDQADLYLDADGDGHGSGAIVETICGSVDSEGNISYPVNRSVLSDDCDDQDADRYPSAPELCTDNIDENCDNDPLAGAVDGDIYFADGDGDGFGSASITLRSCTVPAGYVTDASDCNDSDSDVFPYVLDQSDPSWVDEELCNGKVDRCQNDLVGDLSPPVDEQDIDGDGYVECELDVAPEAWEDQNITVLGGGDCDPSDSSIYPNAVELCNGFIEDCNSTQLPETEIDDDGDGYVECLDFDPLDWQGDPDVVGGGDCNDSSDVTYVGAAYLSHPTECATDIDFDGLADKSWDFCANNRGADERQFTLYGSAVGGLLGYSTTKIPDMDNDGIDELAISAPNADVGQSFEAGIVYIFLGSTLSQLTGEVDVASADYVIYAETSGRYLGRYIKGLDINDDGVGDLIVSADHGVHIFLGGNILLSSSQISESQSNQFLNGYSISFVAKDNDINGNGSDELLFMANPDIYWLEISDLMSLSNPNLDDHHIQYIDFNVYSGYLTSYAVNYAFGAADFDGDNLLDYIRNGSVYFSSNQYQSSGYANGGYLTAKTQGDINGDGVPDLIGSSPVNQVSIKTRIYFGPTDSIEIDMKTEPGFIGDIDQDGLDDIIVSESFQDVSYVFLGSTLSSGQSYFTSADADFVLEGGGTFWWHHERLDDMDGDGYDDVAIMNHLDGTFTPQGGTLSVYSACPY